MIFVERNAGGKITGVYAVAQKGYAEEELPDDHADVIAFRNPPQRAPTKDRAERILDKLVARGVLTAADAVEIASGG